MALKHLVSLLVTLHLSRAVWALSSTDVELAFPGQTSGLSGSSTSLGTFDFAVVTNSSHALFVLNVTSTSPSSAGWIGVGPGTRMGNADMLVAWSHNGNWVLSRRQSRDQEEPSVASSSSGSLATDLYTVVPELSVADSGSSYTSLAVLRALSFSSEPGTSTYKTISRGSQEFIWGAASSKPSSSDPAAGFREHNRGFGTFSLALDSAVTISGTGTGSSGGTSSGDVVSSQSSSGAHTYTVILLHAILGGLGFVIVMPLAVVYGRFGRAWPKWWLVHAWIQVLATLLVITSFILGLAYRGWSSLFQDSHGKTGAVLVAAVVFQSAFGYVAHLVRGLSPELAQRSRLPTLSLSKNKVRHLHILIGVVIVGAGWWQVGGSGFHEWNMTGSSVPTWVKLVFWVLIGIIAAAWLGGWLFEAVIARRNRRRAQWCSQGDDTAAIEATQGDFASESMRLQSFRRMGTSSEVVDYSDKSHRQPSSRS